jgi:hypothetical protein
MQPLFGEKAQQFLISEGLLGAADAKLANAIAEKRPSRKAKASKMLFLMR